MSRRRPGNGSATLLDMLSNLFYFSPPPTTPSVVDGERAATRRVANTERQTETEREKERERKKWKNALGENRYPPPYLLPPLFPPRNPPRAHIDAIFQYRVKRSLASPSPLSSFAGLLSLFPAFRLFSLASRFPRRVEQRISRHAARREKHETRKRRERERGGDGGNPGICDRTGRNRKRKRKRNREKGGGGGGHGKHEVGSTRRKGGMEGSQVR